MSQVSHSPKCYALLCTSVDVSAALSWLPRMLHAKISASLELFFRTCFLYLQYSAPSRLLLSSAALVFFFLLLQNSSFFRAGRRLLSSEPKAWLVSMRVVRVVRRVVRVVQVVRVVRVVRRVVRVVRVVQLIRRVLALYWSYTTGLLYRKYYSPCPFIWTFLQD